MYQKTQHVIVNYQFSRYNKRQRETRTFKLFHSMFFR
ncbi:hypothetical protein [Bacillus phage FI_KG-Lek]|nr:hypothetical protein [Bacillus phage FI_KG-Lek]